MLFMCYNFIVRGAIMTQEIILKVILTVVSFITTGVLGYLVAKIKSYKDKIKNKNNENDLLKDAIMTMLQSNLTNTYYVYENTKAIPDYVYKNWLNMLKMYEQLGGNDYVHVLAEKMKHWDFEKTDILK